MPKAPITLDHPPQVFIRDGEVFANSMDVAKTFKRQHGHVLRDIDRLVGEGLSNFGETPRIDPQNGCEYRTFDMDRDGFSVLCMGFTGTKALKWKLDFVRAFTAMETELQSNSPAQPVIDMRDPQTMVTAFLQVSEIAREMKEAKERAESQVEIAIAHIVEQQPLVDLANAVRETRTTYGLRTVARLLEINERVFFSRMRERFLFVEDGVLTPLAQYRHRGLFTQKLHRMEDGTMRRQTRVTGKGLDHLRVHFRSRHDLFTGSVDLPKGLPAPRSHLISYERPDGPC